MPCNIYVLQCFGWKRLFVDYLLYSPIWGVNKKLPGVNKMLKTPLDTYKKKNTRLDLFLFLIIP